MDWSSIITVSLFAAGLRLAVPTALAAVGECFCERAGVLNLGLEGMMLSGALASFLGAYYSHSLVVGVFTGVGAGLVVGAVKAFLSVTLKTDQVINGIAIVIFAQGITAFTYEKIFSLSSKSPQVAPLHAVEIPVLGSIPWVGPVLFNQNVLIYVSLLLALSVWVLLYRTRFGLYVRAVGENPAAGDAAAVHVDRVRWLAVLVCGALAGLGGAVLIVGEIGIFTLNVTAGRGWVAIALVIFGRWNPILVLGGALLFGFTDALQLRIQASSGGTESGVPYELFQALPYLITLVVMVAATMWSRRDAQPSALGLGFVKEVRD
jgi:simple sugar transport system permease protein